MALDSLTDNRPPTPPLLEAREAHLRIADNLGWLAGLVRVQAAGHRGDLNQANARLMLRGVGTRLEDLGRFHRALSQGSAEGKANLADHLASICDVVEQSCTLERPVDLSCDAHPVELDLERANLIGLFVSELVTNALKFAHPAAAPGRIEVRCRTAGRRAVTISVADDGVGLPESFDPAIDGGFGFAVVRSLAERLGAALEFQSGGLGLTVRLTVPISPNPSRPRAVL